MLFLTIRFTKSSKKVSAVTQKGPARVEICGFKIITLERRKTASEWRGRHRALPLGHRLRHPAASSYRPTSGHWGAATGQSRLPAPPAPGGKPEEFRRAINQEPWNIDQQVPNSNQQIIDDNDKKWRQRWTGNQTKHLRGR